MNWQRTGSGTLAADQPARRPTAATPSLPEDLDDREGETIIAAEVFYSFKPLFGIGLAPRTIHRVAYYKPRLGSLDSLLP